MKGTVQKLLAAVAMTALLTGCTSGQKQEQINLGMDAIGTLAYEEALTYFEEAIAGGEDEELSYRGQGIAYIGLTRYEEAAEALERSLSYCNGYVGDLQFDTNYYLATAYYKNGDVQRAMQIYDAMIDMRENEKDAYYLRGILKLETDDFEGAQNDFEKAVALNPKDYDCLFDIYRSMEKNGYQEAGAVYLQEALEQGEASMSEYDKGRLYYYLKDYDNAKNALEKARDTGSEEAVLFLGRTYEALGDFNYASSVYTEFLNAYPDSPRIQNQLGVCKMQKSEYEEALAAFQAGLASEDKSYMQTLKLNEIAAYEKLAQFQKAAVLMEGYLAAYPDDERAKREYEFLKTR